MTVKEMGSSQQCDDSAKVFSEMKVCLMQKAGDYSSKYPIFKIAENEWDQYKADCSGYLKAVARDVGIILQGDANQLVDFFTQAVNWKTLGTDSLQASKLAEQGYFVVAGKKEAVHGHVVVIVPGRSPKGNAMGYWGMLGKVGHKNTGLEFAWKHSDLPSVQYFACAVPNLSPKP